MAPSRGGAGATGCVRVRREARITARAVIVITRAMVAFEFIKQRCFPTNVEPPPWVCKAESSGGTNAVN